MKHRPSSPRDERFSDEDALRLVAKVIAFCGREVDRSIYAHVQPHAHATASLAYRFAHACGYNGRRGAPTFAELEYGAYLHDIGKYFIAPDVLLKPTVLDADDRAVIELHPVYGDLILAKLPYISDPIRRITLRHHEHWDGSGYPDGLSGFAIPLGARIIAVIDTYAALRARRSYKPTLQKHEALATLIAMAGRELDPSLVEDFLKFVGHRQPPRAVLRLVK